MFEYPFRPILTTERTSYLVILAHLMTTLHTDIVLASGFIITVINTIFTQEGPVLLKTIFEITDRTRIIHIVGFLI